MNDREMIGNDQWIAGRATRATGQEGIQSLDKFSLVLWLKRQLEETKRHLETMQEQLVQELVGSHVAEVVTVVHDRVSQHNRDRVLVFHGLPPVRFTLWRRGTWIFLILRNIGQRNVHGTRWREQQRDFSVLLLVVLGWGRARWFGFNFAFRGQSLGLGRGSVVFGRRTRMTKIWVVFFGRVRRTRQFKVTFRFGVMIVVLAPMSPAAFGLV
jgi:hypothetical protein